MNTMIRIKKQYEVGDQNTCPAGLEQLRNDYEGGCRVGNEASISGNQQQMKAITRTKTKNPETKIKRQCILSERSTHEEDGISWTRVCYRLLTQRPLCLTQRQLEAKPTLRRFGQDFDQSIKTWRWNEISMANVNPGWVGLCIRRGASLNRKVCMFGR